MYDGNSSENDYWNELLVKMIGLDELDDHSESDTEDGFGVFDGDRQCFPSGAGTSRPNRSPPVLSSLARMGRPTVAGILGWTAIGVASFSNVKCSPGIWLGTICSHEVSDASSVIQLHP